MELMFMLFVMVIIFIVIPLLAIVGLVWIIYSLININLKNNNSSKNLNDNEKEHNVKQPEQKKEKPAMKPIINNGATGFSKWFYSGLDEETVPSYSFIKNSNSTSHSSFTPKNKPANNKQNKTLKNTIKLFDNYVETLNEKTYGVFKIVDFTKTGDLSVSIDVCPLPFFNEEMDYDRGSDEVYFNFITDNDYIVRIKQTYEKDSLTTGYLVDELNKDFNKYLKYYVEKNGSYIIQQDFQNFAKHKTIDVDELNIVFNVNKGEIFKVEEFSELKKVVKRELDTDS